MSLEEVRATQLLEFIKKALSADEAGDQDILALVKLVGEKMIKGEQGSEQTKQLLKQVLKDTKEIDALIVYFTNQNKQFEDLKKQKEKQVTEANKAKIQNSGKAVVNKSQSQVPDIYKQTTSRIKNKPQNHEVKKNIGNSQKRNQNTKNNKGQKEIFNRFSEGESKQTKQPIKKQKKQQQNGETQQNIVLKPDLQGKSKCKFFPFCTNQSCEFFHPTQKCPHFPRCRFKQNCLFIHEACKFGESCTRADCFYDHPLKSRKSNNPLLNMMKMMMAGKQPMMKKTQKKPFKSEKAVQQQQQ